MPSHTDLQPLRDARRERDWARLLREAADWEEGPGRSAPTVDVRRALVEMWRARALRMLGRVAEGRAASERAISLAEGTDPTVLVDALNERTWHVPWTEKAALHQRAFDVARRAGEPGSVFVAGVKLAEHRIEAGDLFGAREVLELGERLAPDLPLRYPMFHHALGRIHLRLGELDRALVAFARAREVALRAGDRLSIMNALASEGDVCIRRGDPRGAREKYLEALALAREIPGTREAMPNRLSQLADAERELGDLDAAEAACAEAQRLLDAAGLHDVPWVRVALAMIDTARDRPDAVRGHVVDLERRLAARGRRGPTTEIGVALLASWVHARTGDLAAFEEAFRRFVSGEREVVVDPETAWLADRIAGRAAERGGPFRTHAARARRLALEQWSGLGRTADAQREVRAFRRLRDLGAGVPLGPFVLRRPLGRGAYGEVWEAAHDSGRRVAIKVIAARESSVEQLENELRAVAALDHPSIVRLLHHGRIDAAAAAMEPSLRAGTPWIATTFAEHGDLVPHLGRLPWERVQPVLVAVLDALAHAHARGLLHLDVKPANVLLGGPADAPEARLADFGLAWSGKGNVKATGTPLYMAPEQFLGQGGLGPWTDLYAVGCLAVALASGAPPFRGTTLEAVRDAHLHAELALAPVIDVPRRFGGWVDRMLAKDPERRFRRAADALRALRPVAARRAPAPSDPDLVEAGLGLFGLRVPPFVGRKAERERLLVELAEAAATGETRVVWIRSPRGVGSTALVRWLSEHAHESGADARVIPVRYPLAPEHLATPGPAVLVGEVGPDGRVEPTIDLGPLPPDEHAALLAGLLPFAPDTLASLAGATAGSAKFAVQLVTELVQRGRFRATAAGFTLRDGEELPRRLSDLWPARVETFLGRCDAVGQAALKLAAHFDPPVRDPRTEPVRAALLDARLVEPVDGGFAFVDEEFRACLRARLGPPVSDPEPSGSSMSAVEDG